MFGKKEKPEICPNCKGRLFLSNRDGSKTCASCGHTIGETHKAHPEDAKAKAAAKMAKCPRCGSLAPLASVGPDGKEIYACSFCGNRFSPIEKPAAPAPAIKKPEKKEEAPAAPKGREPLEGREVFALAKANTVEVHTTFNATSESGSGFFVAENYILTNATVIIRNLGTVSQVLPRKILVNFKDGEQKEIKWYGYDPKTSLAILQVEMPCEKIAKIAEEAPATGEEIYAVGNSDGRGMCIMEGLVADQLRAVEGKKYMMISANIVNGNAGGPVYNAYGEVVGLVDRNSGKGVAINYAVPIPAIEGFLDKVNNEFNLNLKRAK